MTSKDFDPDKFIDRDFEQELFEKLLQFRDNARILAIRDSGGMGKSLLLEKFQYRCRTVRPRVPVSLVALDQLADTTPLGMVRKIKEHLSAYGIDFPSFTRYEAARMSADFELFRESIYRERRSGDTVRIDIYSRYERGLHKLIGRIGRDHPRYIDVLLYQQRLTDTIGHARLYGDTEGYRVERAQILDQLNRLVYLELHETFHDMCGGDTFDLDAFEGQRSSRSAIDRETRDIRRGELTPEQELAAQEVIIRALLEDLRSYCDERPVVLLVDAYEKIPETLKSWFMDHLLEQQFFDLQRRPKHLMLVLAGREIPAFSRHWSSEDCRAIVRSVSELGKWTRDHMEECLRVHGFKYELQDIDAFHRLIDRGIPPSQVVQMVQALAAGRGQV